MSIDNVIRIAVLVLCGAVFSVAQQKEVKHVPIQRTSAASAQEMFTTYCAVCHGKDGKGNVPAANTLKVLPADLTMLAKRTAGNIPASVLPAPSAATWMCPRMARGPRSWSSFGASFAASTSARWICLLRCLLPVMHGWLDRLPVAQ